MDGSAILRSDIMKSKNYTVAAIVVAMLSGCSPAVVPDEADVVSDPQVEALASTDEEATVDQEAEATDGPVTGGVYEVDGISVNYYSQVPNDATGNWRLGVVYDDTDLKEYVVDYYNYFCRDDIEVHGIVNLGLKTTAAISKVMSDTLDVTVMEYVDGEEHDADLLYSGAELERYWINMETGEVDPVEEDE